MNPFLSTEQSRQVIQAALTDGYSGKSFDMVTSFITHNLTDMNMSVAQSMDLVRKNVQEGGQSFAGLLTDLGALKEMSRTGNKSLPEYTAEFSATTSNLMNAGMPGGQAARAAMVSSSMFNGQADQGIKDMGTQITNAFSGTRGMALMQTMGGVDVPKGMLPGAMPYAMSGDQMAQASQKVVSDWAKKIHQTGGSPPQSNPPSGAYANNIYRFHIFLQQQGIQVSGVEAKQYYDAVVYENRDPFEEGRNKAEKASATQTAVQNRSYPSSVAGGMVSSGAAVGNMFLDLAHTAANTVGDIFTGHGEEIGDRWRGYVDRGSSRFSAVGRAAATHSIPAMENVIREYGPNGFEILDENGRPVPYAPDGSNQNKMLSSGAYKIRPRGSAGGGFTLAELPPAGEGYRDRVALVQGNLTVSMDPAAQRAGLRAPSTVQLTPHEQQANAGYGGAAPNNAPPGEGPLTRGSR
jgi:hypothetical protein